MRSKPVGWYQLFFGLLEKYKHNEDLKFEEVIREIFAKWNEVHPSFTSKMIATINPTRPVYDKEVCKHLGVKGSNAPNAESRLSAAIKNLVSSRRSMRLPREARLPRISSRPLIEGSSNLLDSLRSRRSI
jgi:hypothetical protein